MLLIALSTLALAQDIEAPPIVGGEETADFVPVGVFTIGYVQNGYLYYDAGSAWCSGTLISANWALTAAHCLDGFNLNQYNNAGYELLFCTGEDLDSGALQECGRLSKLVMHEDYDARYVSYDVGVVEIEDDMSASGTYPLNTDRPNSLGNYITYVGWGSNTRYQGPGGGTKRTVELPLVDYDSQNLTTYGEGQNVCSGDSGGAALQRDGGEWELVGVNSTVASYNYNEDSCSGSQVLGNSMRVDVFYDWIVENADLDGSGNNGGGGGDNNNGGGGGDNNGGGGGDTEPEDTGSVDTADPGGNNGGGKKNNNNKNDDDIWSTCSSVPLRTGGLMGLLVLGAALIGRRRS